MTKDQAFSGISAYLSPKGSFSRKELLIAFAALLAVFIVTQSLTNLYPHALSPVYPYLVAGLYALWGFALGKRSLDLGTTFTYGALVGTLFPVIGIVFLFQAGKKERESLASRRADDGMETAATSDAGN